MILLTLFVSVEAVDEFVIEDIRVEGLKRITPGTVFNYLPMKVGDKFNDSIRDIVGAQGADIVVETTGNSRVIEQAYELTHPDGKTILVGVPRKGDNVNIYSLPLHFNKVLTGYHGGDAVPDLEIPRYIRLMESGKMNLNGLNVLSILKILIIGKFIP